MAKPGLYVPIELARDLVDLKHRLVKDLKVAEERYARLRELFISSHTGQPAWEEDALYALKEAEL